VRGGVVRRIGIICIAASAVLTPGTAWADHDRGDRYGHGSDYGGNEREEDYEGANCKYVCPQFDRSPVRDAFNLHVCMPGATCHYDGEKQQPEEGEMGARER